MDWQREAVWYRFKAGAGMRAIATAYNLSLEDVEACIRSTATGEDVQAVATTTSTVARVTRAKKPAPPVVVREPATAPPTARRSRKAPAEGPDWQARARTALQGRPASASVSELVTVLRIPDAERQVATARLWAALAALVKRGEVRKQGTRYQLSTNGVAAVA